MPRLIKEKKVGPYTVKLRERLPGEHYGTRFAVTTHDGDDCVRWTHVKFFSDPDYQDRAFDAIVEEVKAEVASERRYARQRRLLLRKEQQAATL